LSFLNGGGVDGGVSPFSMLFCGNSPIALLSPLPVPLPDPFPDTDLPLPFPYRRKKK